MEKLEYLVQYLLQERNENIELKNFSKEDKKRLFRTLCNIREPKPISSEFLKMQDKYLIGQLKLEEIIDNIENSKVTDKIYLWKGDITKLKVEAIVNAANSQGLRMFCTLP